MRFLNPLLALVLLWSITACESSETIELAGATDQFISIDHAGSAIELTHPVESYYRQETIAGTEIDDLIITRRTTDGARKLQLRLEGGNLRNRRYPKSFGSSEGPAEKVEIVYTSFGLDNDPVCPHLVGEPTHLEGTIQITGWAEDGIMTGTFETIAAAEYQITGNFRVLVP